MSHDVSARIEEIPARKFISLNESEKNIYKGYGWQLARFVDGQLVELFDPMSGLDDYTTRADRVLAMGDATMAWINVAVGEIWLVMFSCYKLWGLADLSAILM